MIGASIVGFGVFVLLNYTDFLNGWTVAGAMLQFSANGLNFVVHRKAFVATKTNNFKKLVAFSGIVFPVVFGGMTFYNVILPMFT